jgi:deazaflavin-dependent oxidoreductase (nitroreductase family)
VSEPNDFNTQVISDFRANHGKVGGPFEGAPMLLLHTRGAKSGQERITPLMYMAQGPRYVIFASAAGADKSPAWYYNLLAHPTSAIEVGDDRLEVEVHELHGAERDRTYAEQAERYPGFADYELKTTRVIPVVALTPVGPAEG